MGSPFSENGCSSSQVSLSLVDSFKHFILSEKFSVVNDWMILMGMSLYRLEMKQVMNTNYIRGTIVSFIIFAKRFSIFAALLTFALSGEQLSAKHVGINYSTSLMYVKFVSVIYF